MGDFIFQDLSRVFKRSIDPVLFPFYILSLLFLVTRHGSLEYKSSATIPMLKIAPIIYLILFINIIKPYREGQLGRVGLKESYHHFFTCGLILSCIGDVMILYPAHFHHSVIAFTGAHILYIFGLKSRYGTSKVARVAIILALMTSAVIATSENMDSFQTAAGICMYNVIINALLFFALAAYEAFSSSITLHSALGAVFFVMSDYLIATNRWITPLPRAKTLIMPFYYLAQLHLTLSVSL